MAQKKKKIKSWLYYWNLTYSRNKQLSWERHRDNKVNTANPIGHTMNSMSLLEQVANCNSIYSKSTDNVTTKKYKILWTLKMENNP